MVSKPSHIEPDLPPVDEHIVEPGTRYEMYDGELVYVPPAKEPHAERHSKVSALVEAHVGPDFNVASEMLTRTSWIDNFAPDVSVYPFARDPTTGGRQLEHIAFEVVSTESLSHAARKASKLVGRGVRRVFAIDIKKGGTRKRVKRPRLLEWAQDTSGWRELDPTSLIEDLVFAVPLPVSALLYATKVDDAIMRALLAKKNEVAMAVMAASEDRGRREGEEKGRREGLAEGREEGRAEGREEGRAEGREEGRAEGREEGRAQGREEGRAEGKEEGRAEGKEEGRAEGKEEGRAEGKEEGRAEGKEEGRRRGLACAVLALLEERGFALDAADQERIFGEADLPRLRRWVRQAPSCTSVAELLAT